MAHSRLDTSIGRNAFKAKVAPKDFETGWVGDRKFRGTEKEVKIKFDPNEIEQNKEFIYHTHPNSNPSPLSALPSEQDLISAIMTKENGIKGLTIFSGDYYTVIVPGDNPKSHFDRYIAALNEGDFEKAVSELKRYGFEIDTGKI